MVVPAPSRSPIGEGAPSGPAQCKRGRATGSPNRWSPVLATSPLYHRHLYWAGPLTWPVDQWVGMAQQFYQNLPTYDFVVLQDESGVCSPTQLPLLLNGLPNGGRAAYAGVVTWGRPAAGGSVVAMAADVLILAAAANQLVNGQLGSFNAMLNAMQAALHQQGHGQQAGMAGGGPAAGAVLGAAGGNGGAGGGACGAAGGGGAMGAGQGNNP